MEKYFKAQEEIQDISNFEIPQILEWLPVNGYYEDKFTRMTDSWKFNFSYASPNAVFAATGVGVTPMEAFSVAKQVLLRQVLEWRKVRLTETFFRPEDSEAYAKPPVIFIVDDDLDTALATEAMFKQLGCQTQVMTDPSEVHRRLSFEEADLIVLDWKLSEELEGKDVVDRANKLIDTFSDLRDRFSLSRGKVITHSVLPRGKISMPVNGYFQHYDHWKKPMAYDELVARGSNALAACGF